jgi:hypothetical protein
MYAHVVWKDVIHLGPAGISSGVWKWKRNGNGNGMETHFPFGIPIPGLEMNI